jgi:hypothetical protein
MQQFGLSMTSQAPLAGSRRLGHAGVGTVQRRGVGNVESPRDQRQPEVSPLGSDSPLPGSLDHTYWRPMTGSFWLPTRKTGSLDPT